MTTATDVQPMTLRAGDAIDEAEMARVRQAMVLEHCKWDPQVGDVSTLAAFPLLIERGEWRQLCAWAEALAAEGRAAEDELLERPDLLRRLGMPRRLLSALVGRGRFTPTAARVVRFDCHPTAEGWRISEANADVPGGFTEASSLARLMADRCGEGEVAGDPAEAWADAIERAGATEVALLSAPGFMEDQQVTAYLARRLNGRGISTHLVGPKQIMWDAGGRALTNGVTPVDAIVRFYQAEWLSRLPRSSQWARMVRGGATAIGNPVAAAIVESKRFPLTWDALRTPMPTWRRLLPETRDPRDAPWGDDDGWLLKTAYCNTGDTVSIRETMTPRQWRSVARSVWWRPADWVAQRRFETLALPTPLGPMKPCVGVYTVDGRAAGAYARLAPGQIVNYAAVDVTLLVSGGERA